MLPKPQRIGLFGPPNNLNKQEVFVCLNKENDEEVEKYFQLTGKKRGNQLIGEVVMTYARFIDFSPDTGLPLALSRTRVMMVAFSWTRKFILANHLSNHADTAAYTLFNAYQTELSVERAAKIYDVRAKRN